MADDEPTAIDSDVTAVDDQATMLGPQFGQPAWSVEELADEDAEPSPPRLTPRRITVLGVAASLVIVAVSAIVAFMVTHKPQPEPDRVAAPSPSAGSPAVALPNNPPAQADCTGAVIGHADMKHPELGMLRVFLFLDRSKSSGPHSAGCVLPVTQTGRVLPAIWIDAFVGNGFGFANPAVDATGNMFVKYKDASNAVGSGVTVLVPTADGFEDVVSYTKTLLSSGDAYFAGENDYYGAELIGPADGAYTIRQKRNTCTPDCAAGNVAIRNLHWDGRQYVPDTAPAMPAPPPGPAPPPEVASGAKIGDVCNDWMKFALDARSGAEMLCFGYPDSLSHGGPTTWFSTATGPMAGSADKPLVGRVGSPCSAAEYTFGRSSDGYSVWCVSSNGNNPVWAKYHP